MDGYPKSPDGGFVIGIYFLATFCFACFESTFSLLVKEKFHYDESHAGYLFTYCGLLAAFLQAGVVGRLNKLFGEQRLIFGSLVLLAISLCLLPLAGHLGRVAPDPRCVRCGFGRQSAADFWFDLIADARRRAGGSIGRGAKCGQFGANRGSSLCQCALRIQRRLPYFVCAGVAFTGQPCRLAVPVPPGPRSVVEPNLQNVS